LNFNIFNSIILAGIIQGLVFGAVVACSKKYRSPSTLILAAFIVSFSFDNFQYFLEDISAISEAQLMTLYFIPFQFFSGTLFLLYGLYLLEPGRKFKRIWLWFFAPFALALIISSVFKILYAVDYDEESLEIFYGYMEGGFEFVSIAFDMSVLVYLYAKIRRSEKRQTLPNDFHSADRFRWFKIVMLSLFVLSVVWLAVTIEDYFYYTQNWYIIYIGMAVTVYWMGHVGIYKFGIEQERKKIRHYSIENRIRPEHGKGKNEHIAALEQLLVAEKRFLDPTLTLDKIAEELKISKSHLSRTINAELGMGFPDYLNSLRVETAKSYLTNPEFAHYTLVAIGLEAGFNSKTTFNAAFKKLASVTPSEYRKNQQIGTTS